jgi:succinate dehydrogenase / fumarate reductase membrane anchor subunit
MNDQPSRNVSRAGSVRPSGGGGERAIWYLMRLSGLALFVLALTHFLILHVINDPSQQTAEFIAQRWSSLFWRANDWAFLSLVLLHAVLGIRIVIRDYLRGAMRSLALGGFYLLGFLLFAYGSAVVFTMATPKG